MSPETEADAPTQEEIDRQREELLRRLSDPMLTIVNVLPRAAWEDSRIPGSLSLPLAEIAERARRVLPDPGQEIVVYCASPT